MFLSHVALKNITKLTFLGVPEEHKNFLIFCLFCLPPLLGSLQNRHTETTSYTYTMTFHIYNNPTSHIIEQVITQVKNHKYET
jgi:hypothetical protein